MDTEVTAVADGGNGLRKALEISSHFLSARLAESAQKHES